MDNMLNIVNFLGKNLHREYTMHELSIILKIPYASFYRTIAQMKYLLIIRNIGRAKTVKLKLDHVTTLPYLTIASFEEMKSFVQEQKMIRAIQSELETSDIVLLFGSYAKREESKHSDVDIMVINKSGKKSLSFSKYEILYKKEINPLCIKEKEFTLMLTSETENVGKQALKGHIVLNNPTRFWQLVQNAFQ